MSDRLYMPDFNYAYVGFVDCPMVFLCHILLGESSFVLLWIRPLFYVRH